MKNMVKFDKSSFDWNKLRLNEPVLLKPIDHPSEFVSNTTYVMTSYVVLINKDYFETENTRYIPV